MFLKYKNSWSHMISYRSLLLSTIVLNDSRSGDPQIHPINLFAVIITNHPTTSSIHSTDVIAIIVSITITLLGLLAETKLHYQLHLTHCNCLSDLQIWTCRLCCHKKCICGWKVVIFMAWSVMCTFPVKHSHSYNEQFYSTW